MIVYAVLGSTTEWTTRNLQDYILYTPHKEFIARTPESCFMRYKEYVVNTQHNKSIAKPFNLERVR